VSEHYAGRQIVGMDLHRRRSVLVRMTDAGERLETVRISNDPEHLAQVMARAGEAPEVVLEAAYGWYWAADTLAELGAQVHLAHPLGVKMFSYRRVKNDQRDAADLADLLRMGRLPEAWIAPPATRELRGWVRHRAKLVGLRSSMKCQVHGVLAHAGIWVPMSDLFGVAGQQLLAELSAGERLSLESRSRLDSALRVITALEFEIDLFAKLVNGRLRTDPGYRTIQQIPGVGAVLAAVFVAEIGDITRFHRPEQLASWAGLTPKHHESDTTVHRGRITKQGSRLVRWAAVEAVQRVSGQTRLGQHRDRVAARRGRNIGVVAAARELLTLVFYGLRDHHIRALNPPLTSTGSAASSPAA
jgi:transposase